MATGTEARLASLLLARRGLPRSPKPTPRKSPPRSFEPRFARPEGRRGGRAPKPCLRSPTFDFQDNARAPPQSTLQRGRAVTKPNQPQTAAPGRGRRGAPTDASRGMFSRMNHQPPAAYGASGCQPLPCALSPYPVARLTADVSHGPLNASCYIARFGKQTRQPSCVRPRPAR